MLKDLRAIIVDDEVLLTESLKIILSINVGMNIVGVAKNGNEALEILKNVQADLALVDLKMDGMDGVELIRNIKQEYPRMKTLVLTTFYEVKDIIGDIRNGADGYILKGSGVDSIVSSIESVMAGRGVLDKEVLDQLSGYMSTKTSLNPRGNFSMLTNREFEVCSLLAQGKSNERISKDLFITLGTARNYISSIYEKLIVRSDDGDPRAAITAMFHEEYGK